MKKKLLIIGAVIIVLIIILFASGGFEKILYKIDPFFYSMFYRDGMIYQPKFSGQFLHYKSEKYGIEIDYPEGYLVNDSLPSDNNGAAIATIESSIYLKTPSNQTMDGLAIMYINIPDEYKNSTAKNIFDDKRKEYSNEPEWISNISSVGEITIQNSQAAYLVYDVDHSRDDKIMRTTKEVGIVHNGKLYILTFNDAKSEYPQSMVNADKMIQSFRFSE